MSGAKHTPGPLHVEDGGGRWDDDGDWESVRVIAADESVIAELLWQMGDAEAEAQTRADAALFASAPEQQSKIAALADALEALIAAINDDNPIAGMQARERAQSALRAAGRLP